MEWQPWLPLYLAEIQKAFDGDAPWRKFVATGCTQSGKTVGTLMIPLLYCLFELVVDVGFAIPTMKLSAKKWELDIKPIIMKTRYANLIPKTGVGSKGGTGFDHITFLNGATLSFISAGGGREERSSETYQYLFCTEADSFSETDETGGEGRKIDQLEARTDAFGGTAYFFAECTVTLENNYVWDTYTNHSSHSQLVIQCPACQHWYLPEREHFVGWQEAKTQLEAGELARFICPGDNCGLLWGDDHRTAMLRGMKLLHRGQTIDENGNISGPVPETLTLGFRWNAALNAFWSTRHLGHKEWEASRSSTQETTDIAREQFAWTKPAKSPIAAMVKLDERTIQKYVVPALTKGLIPADVQVATIGLDIGKWSCHWTLTVRTVSGLHVADYGVVKVEKSAGWQERDLIAELEKLHQRIEQGWTVHGSTDRYVPDVVMIDSGYLSHLIYRLCRAWGPRYRPLKGFGFGQDTHKGGDSVYRAPDKKGGAVKYLGNGFHVSVLEDRQTELFHVDADHWKSELQDAIALAESDSTAFSLFDDLDSNHKTFRKHLVVEQRRIETKLIEGAWKFRWVWRKVGPGSNHYLDCTCYSLCGIEFVEMWNAGEAASEVEPAKSTETTGFTMPDGRPYLIGNRETQDD
jgi:phage terminase large subunit GpA-like protein